MDTNPRDSLTKSGSGTKGLPENFPLAEEFKRTVLTYAVAVAIFVFFVFIPTLYNGFVNWDDDLYVVDNEHIRSFNAETVKWAFSTLDVSYWHPLTWLSLAADNVIWGGAPYGFHLTNAIFHSLNAFLVVLLVFKLLAGWHAGKLTSITDSRFALTAAFCGLLFGIHPMQVETVAWVAERKNLLYAFFYLLSIMAYMFFAAGEKGNGRKRTFYSFVRNRYYLTALVLFLCSLMSKPMAVSLPVVLFIFDWCLFERFSRGRVRAIVAEKAPFLLMSIAASALTIVAQLMNNTIAPLDYNPLGNRILNAVNALFIYPVKILFPFNLAPLYLYERNIRLLSPGSVFSIFFVLIVTAACILMVKKQKRWLGLWLTYLAILFPVLGIVQAGGQAMADRYIYLASIPFFVIIAAGLSFPSAVGRRSGAIMKTVAYICFIMVTASLAFLTIKQTEIWRDGVSLWSREIMLYPSDAEAYNSRGGAQNIKGELNAALADYDEAIRLAPANAGFYRNRGLIYMGQGRNDKAVMDFSKAIELKPEYLLYLGRGNIYISLARYGEALNDYEKALQFNARPDYTFYYNRALSYKGLGREAEAARDFAESERVKTNIR